MNDQNIRVDLSSCKTVKEAFAVLDKYYKLEEANLSALYRNILIMNLENLIQLLKVKKRDDKT